MPKIRQFKFFLNSVEEEALKKSDYEYIRYPRVGSLCNPLAGFDFGKMSRKMSKNIHDSIAKMDKFIKALPLPEQIAYYNDNYNALSEGLAVAALSGILEFRSNNIDPVFTDNAEKIKDWTDVCKYFETKINNLQKKATVSGVNVSLPGFGPKLSASLHHKLKVKEKPASPINNSETWKVSLSRIKADDFTPGANWKNLVPENKVENLQNIINSARITIAFKKELAALIATAHSEGYINGNKLNKFTIPNNFCIEYFRIRIYDNLRDKNINREKDKAKRKYFKL